MSDTTDPRWEVIRPALSALLGLEVCEDADLVRGLLEELLEQRAAAVADGRATQDIIAALQARCIDTSCDAAYHRSRWLSVDKEVARLRVEVERMRLIADDLRASLASADARIELMVEGAL